MRRLDSPDEPRGDSGDDAEVIDPRRDFDAEIAGANARADALRGEMAHALAAWLDATAPWAAAFWECSIAESVQEEPDAVVALDDDVRRAAKHRAAELIANARTHIERRLVEDRSEDWPHLKPQTDPHDHAFRREGTRGAFEVLATASAGRDEAPPQVVAGRLNGVLGDIASVCGDYGFELRGFGRGDPFGHSGRWHPDREHRPQWSEQMRTTMATYASLHDRYVATIAEGRELEAVRRRAEAGRLWDTA
jgi:hypothetical protein